MIGTDKFVYIHMPKTGGTFVTHALYALYQNEPGVVGVPDFGPMDIYKNDRYGKAVFWSEQKHAPCWMIPGPQRHKPILATIRNPYDWYVSHYEFGWWKKEDYLPCFHRVPDFAEAYPRFPDIPFKDYLELVNSPFCWYAPRPGNADEPAPRGDLGMYTLEFMWFYFNKPEEVYPVLDDNYIASGRYRGSMFPVQFIHMERLNVELFDFLVEMGYWQEDVRFILDLGKILPGKGRTDKQAWPNYYTPELKQSVRDKDRLLFTLFPEFDI